MRVSSKCKLTIDDRKSRPRIMSPYNSKIRIPRVNSNLPSLRCSSRGSGNGGIKQIDNMRKSLSLKYKQAPGRNILEIDGRSSNDIDKLKS